MIKLDTAKVFNKTKKFLFCYSLDKSSNNHYSSLSVILDGSECMMRFYQRRSQNMIRENMVRHCVFFGCLIFQNTKTTFDNLIFENLTVFSWDNTAHKLCNLTERISSVGALFSVSINFRALTYAWETTNGSIGFRFYLTFGF